MRVKLSRGVKVALAAALAGGGAFAASWYMEDDQHTKVRFIFISIIETPNRKKRNKLIC